METQAIQIPSDLRVTKEQFLKLVAANDLRRLERGANGELVVNPPTGGEAGRRNADITYCLKRWSLEGGGGLVFDSSTGFDLPGGATLSPDVAWITDDRWQSLSTQQRKQFVPLAPDFVIELKSESDSLVKLQEKLRHFMDNGVRLGWLIDPQHKTAHVYRANNDADVLDDPTSLDGEDVLPGF
jgi:Uma2 family endonuclease